MKNFCLVLLLLSLYSCDNDQLVNLKYKLKNETGQRISISYHKNQNQNIIYSENGVTWYFYGYYVSPVELENLEEFSFYDTLVSKETSGLLFPYDNVHIHSSLLEAWTENEIISYNMSREADTLENSIFKEKNWKIYSHKNNDKTMIYTIK